jgi:hypothetical protein
MRIIDKEGLHDYYDCVMSSDQDRSIIYQRNYTEEAVPNHKSVFCYHGYDRQYGFSIRDYTIGFAGKVYPLTHVNYNHTYDDVKINEYIYNAEDVLRIVKAEPPKSYWERQQAKWEDRFYPRFVKAVKTFFSRQIDYGKFFDKAPIFLIDHGKYPDPIIRYNTILRGYNFQKVLDPYTAYQELRMYIEGQAQPSKPIPKVSDEVMQEIKGFTHKYSFRKEPKA